MVDFVYICVMGITLSFGFVACQSQSHYNPMIIQDSRLEPKVDGTFGFQYRTEDGISHAAQRDPSGFIQGSYSYKDPTGLKVNFNYFAGGRKDQKAAPQPQYTQTNYNNPEPQYSSQTPQYYSDPDPYQQTQEYRPRTKPPSAYTQPLNQPVYQRRYTDSTPSRFNEVYDDYQNTGYNS